MEDFAAESVGARSPAWWSQSIASADLARLRGEQRVALNRTMPLWLTLRPD